jgi:dihydroorotate dehydrogenase
LKRALEILGERRTGKLIVSVGGVMSAEDVEERLEIGADLVQVYAALIFEGPYFLRKVAKWQASRKS